MDVDVVEFQVPVENNKTVFVWNIHPSHSHAHIHEELQRVFSSFGPVYLLQVRANDPLGPPGFYALVKFFSAAQAAEAQRGTDRRSLFQSSPLKVRLSSKETPHFLSDRRRPLSPAHCRQLANHCLGFNGWTSDIITLKELTNEEEEEEEGGGRWRMLRFGCLLRLCFPHHRRTTTGAAVVEDRFTYSGPCVLLQKRCKLQKLVRERALVQAFSTVLLILLGDKRVMVEVKQTSDQLIPDLTDPGLQVNEFPADEEEEEEEEEEWDLTVS